MVSKKAARYPARVCESSDAASRSSSRRAAASSWLAATFVTDLTAWATDGEAPAVASTSCASEVRTAGGKTTDASQCFAPVARWIRRSAAKPFDGDVSSASLATRYTAMAVSRGPPSGARPASAASAANRNGVGASPYGGFKRCGGSTQPISPSRTRLASSRGPVVDRSRVGCGALVAATAGATFHPCGHIRNPTMPSPGATDPV